MYNNKPLLLLFWIAINIHAQSLLVDVGKNDMLFLDGENLILGIASPLPNSTGQTLYNWNPPFVTDASFSTLRQKDGSVTLINPVWTSYFLWRNSDIDQPSIQKQLNQLTLTRTMPMASAMMPRGHMLNFAGAIGNDSLSQFPYQYGMWMPNIYQINDQELLGFVHVENYEGCGIYFFGGDTPQSACIHQPIYRIGLAYSRDGGMSWQWLGTILTPHYNENVTSNLGGVPYLVVGDYLYVYFNETLCNIFMQNTQGQFLGKNGEAYNDLAAALDITKGGGIIHNPSCRGIDNQYISVARSPIASVIESARRGQLSEWKKFSGTTQQGATWSEPALGGKGSRVSPQTVGAFAGVFDSHGDAAFSKTLGKYLMFANWCCTDALMQHGSNGMYMLVSEDGLEWSESHLIFPASPSNGRTQYQTVIGKPDDFSSNDFSVVGNSFYLLYPFYCIDPLDTRCKKDRPPDLLRKEIRLSSNRVSQANIAIPFQTRNGVLNFSLTNFPSMENGGWVPSLIFVQVESMDNANMSGSITIENVTTTLDGTTSRTIAVPYSGENVMSLVLAGTAVRPYTIKWWPSGPVSGANTIGASSVSQPSSSTTITQIMTYDNKQTYASGSCVNIDVTNTAPTWLGQAYFRCAASNIPSVVQTLTLGSTVVTQQDAYNEISLRIGGKIATDLCLGRSDGNAMECRITNY